MLIIGEKINSSRKLVAKAMEEHDAAFIRNKAETQASAGAHYLDVNAGGFAEREPDSLAWLIETVQDAVDLPICVESPNPQAIQSVLPHVRRPFMINSITLEPARLGSILRLAVNSGAKVIGLCHAEGPMARTTDHKVSLAAKLVNRTFFIAALVKGLDSVMINPTDNELYASLKSGMMVTGRDD